MKLHTPGYNAIMASQISDKTVAQIKAIIKEYAYALRHLHDLPPRAEVERAVYSVTHTHPLIEWEEGGHFYAAAFSTNCSEDIIYPSPIWFKDGYPTGYRTIRRSLRRIERAKAILKEAQGEA